MAPTEGCSEREVCLTRWCHTSALRLYDEFAFL